MFRVKICGLRFASEVAAVASFEGAAIGLNFYAPSIRYLDPTGDQARSISVAAQAAGVLRVGVFVNEAIDKILAIQDAVGLDVLQLHGDEPIELAEQLIGQGQTVIRAIKLPRAQAKLPRAQAKLPRAQAKLPRASTDSHSQGCTAELIASRSRAWANAGCHLLLDADAGAAHGGSGKTLDWESVASWAKQVDDSSWTLAGGLNPDNVNQAMAASGAKRVDTASGVESPKGTKSADLIRRFCQNAGL